MTLNSSSAEELSTLLAQAGEYHASGQLAQAASLYQNYLYRRTERAEFARTLHFSELDITIVNRLADVLHQAEKPGIAAEVLEWALELVPQNAQCLNNLAIMRHEMQHYDAAVRAFRKALTIQPDYVDAQLNLAQSLEQQGCHEEALAVLQQTLLHDAGNEQALEARAMLFYKTGDGQSAAAAFRQWLRIAPDNPVAAHMLAACCGDSRVKRASDAYIKQHFDAFACSYDRQLRRIRSQGPRLIRHGMALLYGNTEKNIDKAILDGGCGTGLIAPLLRPYARYLCGVDLSCAMLAKARATGCYDELSEAELTRFMGRRSAAYDVLVFSDSLPYYGDLGALLSAAKTALRKNGHLLFTAEALARTQNSRYRLHESGRFQHNESYLYEILSASALHTVFCEKVILREEFGEPVEGFMFAAQKRSE